MSLSLQQVHEDPRGSIYSIVLPTNQELMLFFCKAGQLRGGHSHDVPELVVLLSGRVRYHTLLNGREQVVDYAAGGSIYNSANVPHMAEFLEESWVAEWKIGVHIGEWTTTEYEPMRSRVRRSIAEQGA